MHRVRRLCHNNVKKPGAYADGFVEWLRHNAMGDCEKPQMNCPRTRPMTNVAIEVAIPYQDSFLSASCRDLRSSCSSGRAFAASSTSLMNLKQSSLSVEYMARFDSTCRSPLHEVLSLSFRSMRRPLRSRYLSMEMASSCVNPSRLFPMDKVHMSTKSRSYGGLHSCWNLAC